MCKAFEYSPVTLNGEVLVLPVMVQGHEPFEIVQARRIVAIANVSPMEYRRSKPSRGYSSPYARFALERVL